MALPEPIQQLVPRDPVLRHNGIDGELLGGCDDLFDLEAAGDLEEKLGL